MGTRIAPAVRDLLDAPEEERRIGPFQLVGPLGRGGFAPVWLAREVYGDVVLRSAAVKIFSLGQGATVFSERGATPASGGGRGVVEEARLLCQVEHPNIVRFYALAVDERRGLVALAMEHVSGRSLDVRLEGGEPLSVRDVLAVGAAVASALSVVHRAGLVHRDVKPANIVESGGVHKLIDFGIAAAERTERAEPKKRVVLDDLPIQIAGTNHSELEADAQGGASPFATGTVGYIDPTCVATGEPAVPASDFYSLGATLFECLTGSVPAVAAAGERGGFKGEVLDGRAAAPSLASFAPEVPAPLVALVDAMLARERAERPPSAEAVALELDRIRRELDGRARPIPPASVGPFRGLARFEAADRDVYFGRSGEVAAALELLRARGLVALIGPSGSGKSSLARAGVLPAVADGALGGAFATWDAAIVSPGADPRAALAAVLAPLVDQEPRDVAAQEPGEVVRAIAMRRASDKRGLVLLVDQLEELVTMDAPRTRASRDWAVRLVAALAERPLPGLRAMVTARRDLLDQLLALPRLGAALVSGSLLVTPLPDGAWGEILDQALGAYDHRFEDAELRDGLLAELRGTGSAMPLVQFALAELWSHRDVERRIIPRAAVEALGGVAGALELHADGVVDAIERSGIAGLAVVRALFLALTTPDGTRRTVGEATLLREVGSPAARAVVGELERARLVVREGEGLTLAHDALLVAWNRLRGWVAEAKDGRLLALELEQDAERWQKRAEGIAPWQGPRLAAAEALRDRSDVGLSLGALAFLRASSGARRRARGLVALALAAVAVAAVIGGTVWVNALDAERLLTRQALERAQQNLTLARDAEQQARAERDHADQLLARLDEATPRSLFRAQPLAQKAAGASPAPTDVDGGTPGPFNRDAAEKAIAAASEKANTCRFPGGAVGSGVIALSFGSDGRVSRTSLIAPQFEGTPTGDCIAAAFGRARIAPFSGQSVTMNRSFYLESAAPPGAAQPTLGRGYAGDGTWNGDAAKKASPKKPSSAEDGQWDGP